MSVLLKNIQDRTVIPHVVLVLALRLAIEVEDNQSSLTASSFEGCDAIVPVLMSRALWEVPGNGLGGGRIIEEVGPAMAAVVVQSALSGAVRLGSETVVVDDNVEDLFECLDSSIRLIPVRAVVFCSKSQLKFFGALHATYD